MFKRNKPNKELELLNNRYEILNKSSENLRALLEFIKDGDKYIKQKKTVDKLAEVEMLTLSNELSHYIVTLVKNNKGIAIQDLDTLLTVAFEINLVPKDIEEQLTYILVKYIIACQRKEWDKPDNLEYWIKYYIDTVEIVIEHIKEKVIPESDNINKMNIF